MAWQARMSSGLWQPYDKGWGPYNNLEWTMEGWSWATRLDLRFQAGFEGSWVRGWRGGGWDQRSNTLNLREVGGFWKSCFGCCFWTAHRVNRSRTLELESCGPRRRVLYTGPWIHDPRSWVLDWWCRLNATSWWHKQIIPTIWTWSEALHHTLHNWIQTHALTLLGSHCPCDQ